LRVPLLGKQFVYEAQRVFDDLRFSVVDRERPVPIRLAIDADVILMSHGMQVLHAVWREHAFDVENVLEVLSGGAIGIGRLDHSDPPGSPLLANLYLLVLTVDLLLHSLNVGQNLLEKPGVQGNHPITVYQNNVLEAGSGKEVNDSVGVAIE